MSRLSVVKREARRTIGVAIYLFGCFLIFTTLDKLFLATHQIEVAAVVPAVIAALALAKVVVLLDLTSLATQLGTRHPVWVGALYKTLLYGVVSAPVLHAERVWHFYRETGLLGEAFVQAWEHINPDLLLAKVIIVSLVFAVYHLYHGIDHRLGEGKLWDTLLSRG